MSKKKSLSRDVKRVKKINKRKSGKKKSVRQVLREQVERVKPEKEVLDEIKKKVKEFIPKLERGLSDEGIEAQVFVGGSFAKGTLVRKDKYDIDVFVRFDWRYENLSDELDKVLKNLGFRFERIHGSRDYFKIDAGKNFEFEIIPVTKIKHPREERNVTDLSYFHVPYVKKKAKGIEEQIILAKNFMNAQKVYGAESYIQGFSGYAVECLVIYYKSFERMLRELSKVPKGERIVIDPEKKFKRKSDVFFELNENKLQSPIILIDPTYKERNATAALSRQTFENFQEIARKFLDKPSDDFFVEKEIDVGKLRKRGSAKGKEFLHLKIETDRQEGDVAGTKLKKFAGYLERELGVYFVVLDKEFEYDEIQGADTYWVLKSKKEIVRIGPPLHMKKNVKEFEKEHSQTYVKGKFVCAKIKVDFSAKDFVKKLVEERKEMVRQMGIVGIGF